MAKAWEVLNVGPDVPLSLCARRIIDTRFREMMSYREGTILGEDIEQLHSMRVSSRRLRSAMRNFRACFPHDEFRYHVGRIRDIADGLGRVRDLDVRIAWFRDFLVHAPRADKEGVRFVIARADHERSLARVPMISLLEQLADEDYETEFLDFVWGEESRDG
ncbi:MAG TPA: CHAD domain-containing protein [Blastocatellia bacterium]|nr:CHAD domain-containing protein [Blastocatellia bacterium]